MAFIASFRDLEVYKLARDHAKKVFEITITFPKEEKYSLTDQIRRSSRSVSANIAEGYRKRQYPNAFVSKMADADGEGAETQGWIDYARDCGYWSPELAAEFTAGNEEVGRMLGGMIAHPEKFAI